MKYPKNYVRYIADCLGHHSNDEYLSRHPEIERFNANMPEDFYFRYYPDARRMHWAIIVKAGTEDSSVFIYFIDRGGRVFDILKFSKKKIAQRRLRKNGFEYTKNRFCPFTPAEPIYIKLGEGKKSAPYSKGKLWESVSRNKKHIDKIVNTYIKQEIEYYEKIYKSIYDHI